MNLRVKQIAVIGAGHIGRILLERLLKAGIPTENLFICDSDVDRVNAVADHYGIRPAKLTGEAVCEADAVLLAVPPVEVLHVVQSLASPNTECRLVISFAAAVPILEIESRLPPGTAVARVMPNAPSLIGQGINPVTFGTAVTDEDRMVVEAILSTLGDTVEVRDDQMNWCVGLTGAAMRSLLPALEGMTKAGIEAGFSEADARRMAAQVMLGTAALALQTDQTFKQIKYLTPMETVDEEALAQLFYTAAETAKERIDSLQRKLWPDEMEIR